MRSGTFPIAPIACGALSLALLGTGAWLFISLEATEAQATAREMQPTASELATALIRSGLDPTALAASGVTAPSVGAVVTAVRSEMVLNPGALDAADASYADARRECDRLERLIQSGRGTPGDVNDYQSALQDLANASAQRGAVLDGYFDLGTAGLSQSQHDTLAVIAANRHWDRPIEFLVVDRSEPEWVELRECLANERIAQEAGQTPDPEAQALLSQYRSDPAVSTAESNYDANFAAVEAAWNDAVGL